MNMLQLAVNIVLILEIAIGEYILVLSFRCTQKQKYSTGVTIVTLVIANLFYMSIKKYAHFMVTFYIMYFVFMILISLIYFTGKWHQRLMGIIIYTIASLLPEMIDIQILLSMGYTLDVVKNPPAELSLLLHTIGVFLELFLTLIILWAQKSVKYVMQIKKILPVLLLFGIQFIMILTYMIVCLQGHLKVDYMTAIYLCVEMFENFYIFQVLSELEVREQTKGKLEVMHRRNQEVEQYYQKLTSNLRNITELKEEYETKLKRIYQEFGLEYIPEVHAEQENDAGDIHINSVAENILQKKKEELEKEGIDYRFEFTVPQEFSMDIMELSSLLNNLLDNAQEAVREYRKCAGCENRGFISLQTRVSDGYLILETENSRPDGRKLEMRDDRTYLSSKEEKGHGYGLQIIRKIAEKYQGSMELQENGDRFKNIVRIRMNSLPV